MAVDKVLGFEGIGELTATFKVASGTTPEVGMAVAFTGNGEVGKATEGTAVGGVIKHVNGDGLVTVQVKGFVENVAITSTSAKQPSVGDVVAVDGAGGLVKLASLTVADTKATVVGFGARVVSVDTTNKLATIIL